MAANEASEAFYDRAAEYVAVLIPAAWEDPTLRWLASWPDWRPKPDPSSTSEPAAESAPPCWRELCPLGRSCAAAAEPAGDEAVTWSMIYRAVEADRQLTEVTVADR